MTLDYQCVDLIAMDLSQKSRTYQDLRMVLTDEQMGNLTREKSSRMQLDDDRRSRREIANCNERRRMQSINSGFERIKSMLPQSEEEKMSKSAILQQAVEYISKLEHEKQIIIQRNAKLQDMLLSKSTTPSMPPTKRRRHDDFKQSVVLSSDAFSSAECLRECDQNASAVLTELQSLVVSLREQLQYENQRRVAVEEKVDSLKTCLRMKQEAEEPSNTSNEQIPWSEAVDSSAVSPSLNARQILSDDHSAVARHNLDTIVKAIIHVEGGGGVLADKTQEEHNRISESKAEECSASLTQYLCGTLPCFRMPLTSGGMCDSTSISVVHTTGDRSTITVAALKPSPVLFVTSGSFKSAIIRPLSNQKPS